MNCERCGVAVRVNPERDPDARLMRHADHGVCANCAITAFLKTMEPLATVIREKGPEILLAAGVGPQMAAALAAGHADARPGEIDWQIVVDQWDLPTRAAA
jgi:hypothetical protein